MGGAIGSASAQTTEQVEASSVGADNQHVDGDNSTGPKHGNHRGHRWVGDDAALTPLPTSPSRNNHYQSEMGLKDPPHPVGDTQERDGNIHRGWMQCELPFSRTEETG